MYGEGISKSGELVDLGTDYNVIVKSGAWYAYEGSKIAQGREAAKQFMLDNPELAAEIEGKIREKLSGVVLSGGSDDASDDDDDEEDME